VTTGRGHVVGIKGTESLGRTPRAATVSVRATPWERVVNRKNEPV
jgi:hypothetical protein